MEKTRGEKMTDNEDLENLSDGEQDILEALTKFGEHSEIEANEIIGYIEQIKLNTVNDYKQKVKDALTKLRFLPFGATTKGDKKYLWVVHCDELEKELFGEAKK